MEAMEAMGAREAVIARAVLIILLAGAGACARDAREEVARQEEPGTISPAPASTSAPAPPAAPDEGWTAGVIEKSGTAQATQTGLRIARHEGYDRLVFEFADVLPGYHIEYVDRPVRACGSGEVVPVKGDAWLLVKLVPARAHTDEGQPTVSRSVPVNAANVLEVKSLCDFEADVQWVAGVAHPGRFRVLELGGPPRLVVDIRVR